MLPLLMFLALLLLPAAELYTVVRVGEVIGGLPTAALLLAATVAGAQIVRGQGRRAGRVLHQALQQGVPPGRHLADAALLLIGGVLLLIPGFLTDLLGLVFVLPFTRPAAGRLLARYAAHRLRAAERRAAAGPFPPPAAGRAEGPPPTVTVIRGEIVDD